MLEFLVWLHVTFHLGTLSGHKLLKSPSNLIFCDIDKEIRQGNCLYSRWRVRGSAFILQSNKRRNFTCIHDWEIGAWPENSVVVIISVKDTIDSWSWHHASYSWGQPCVHSVIKLSWTILYGHSCTKSHTGITSPAVDEKSCISHRTLVLLILIFRLSWLKSVLWITLQD